MSRACAPFIGISGYRHFGLTGRAPAAKTLADPMPRTAATDRAAPLHRSMDFFATLGRPRSGLIVSAKQAAAARRAGADRIWHKLAAVVLFAAAILVLLTFTDYGVTWDEDVHNGYGILVLNYYLSLFADQRALHWLDLYHYGAAFDMTAAALNRFSPLGIYETRHLLNGVVGILGLAGCWKLIRAAPAGAPALPEASRPRQPARLRERA